ncbi:MAG: hypothetical protein II610_03545 [Treponema sp.]|nr:hypothetical protein [Treponema sp.]
MISIIAVIIMNILVSILSFSARNTSHAKGFAFQKKKRMVNVLFINVANVSLTTKNFKPISHKIISVKIAMLVMPVIFLYFFGMKIVANAK